MSERTKKLRINKNKIFKNLVSGSKCLHVADPQTPGDVEMNREHAVLIGQPCQHDPDGRQGQGQHAFHHPLVPAPGKGGIVGIVERGASSHALQDGDCRAYWQANAISGIIWRRIGLPHCKRGK